jgi:hypothetical protein
MWRYSTLIVLLLIAGTGPILFAQAVNPEQIPQASALGQQGVISVILSFYLPRLMEILKGWKRFPLLQDGARRLNQFIAVLVATAQSVGLTYTYHSGQDGWTLMFGSGHSSIEEFGVAFALTLATQQFFYEQIPAVQADNFTRAMISAVEKMNLTSNEPRH